MKQGLQAVKSWLEAITGVLASLLVVSLLINILFPDALGEFSALDNLGIWMKSVGDNGLAGVLAILGYGLVVWSMQFIEIAYVSSIREVSIVLATIISLYILKEKDAFKRIIPSMIIVSGVAILYFQIT